MRKLISCLVSFLLVTTFVPAVAFADPDPRASGTVQLSISYEGYESSSAAAPAYYSFTIRASDAATDDIVVAYGTFQGSTEGEWYVPVRSTATIEQGRQSVDIAVEAAQPSDDSLDRYIASTDADKYFGLALLAASGAEINAAQKTATVEAVDITARASTVDLTGQIGSDEEPFLKASFAPVSGGPIEGSMPFSVFGNTGDGYYWALDPDPLEHVEAIDIRDLSNKQMVGGDTTRLDPYFFAAGGLRFLYSIDYELNAADRYHLYAAEDVETTLRVVDDATQTTVLAGSASLEAWRTAAISATTGNWWEVVPLVVAAPHTIPTAMTVNDFTASVSSSPTVDNYGDEYVHGYDADSVQVGPTEQAGGRDLLYVSENPIALTASVTLAATNPSKSYAFDIDQYSPEYHRSDFEYGYSMTDPMLVYAVSDTRPPVPRTDAAAFSQAQFTTGDEIRISVPFDEIVASAPQAATLALGDSGATVDLTLAGGVGTNVLEYAGAYSGQGATAQAEALACTLSIPAGVADLAGNATSEPATVSAFSAFSEERTLTVPLAPDVTAADANGAPVQDGTDSATPVTLAIRQPEGDPAVGAVVAYDVTEDGGATFARVDAAPNGGATAYTIDAKGQHDVAVRAVAVGEVAGPLCTPLSFGYYDEGDLGGAVSLAHDDATGRVEVHRAQGSRGAQRVHLRAFQASASSAKVINLLGDDWVDFADGETDVSKQIRYEWAYDNQSKYLPGFDDRQIGIEIERVEALSGDEAAVVDPAAASVLLDTSSHQYNTSAIYAADGQGNPVVPGGGAPQTISDTPGDYLIVGAGESKSSDLDLSFDALGTSAKDIYYHTWFDMDRENWSFTGMYDVTTELSIDGTTAFKAWEDYDNTGNNGTVDIPGGADDAFNHTEFNDGCIATKDYISRLDSAPRNGRLFCLKQTSLAHSLGTLSISCDSRLGKDCVVTASNIWVEGFAVDAAAPEIESVSVGDAMFYPGNEFRVYVDFNESVKTADVTARIYDENHANCYGTLRAGSPRAAGTTDDTLVGLGGQTVMLSGYLGDDVRALPDNVVIEVEAANVTDCVGHGSSPSATATLAVDSSEEVQPPDAPDDPGEKSGATYGYFSITAGQGADTFLVTRTAGAKGRQQVYFRTLFGTNDPGNPCFTPAASNSVMFEEGQQTATIVIQPRKADTSSVGYYSDADVKRRYGVELFDVEGGGELSGSCAYRDATYSDDSWSVDLRSYLYLPGVNTTMQRACYDVSHLSFTTTLPDKDRYFKVVAGDNARVYAQLHEYQNKKKFLLTANNVTTTVTSGTGVELYQGEEDFDNTNKDSCYFPESVPINSGNKIDDSAYTASISARNMDECSVSRVYDLSRSDAAMTYKLLGGTYNDNLEVKDAWLDYLYHDGRAPLVMEIHPSATDLVAGGPLSVSVAMDEIVFDQGSQLEVWTSDGATRLGSYPCAAGSGTTVLEYAGRVPDGYQGGAYKLVLTGLVTDKSGNALDTSDPSCSKAVDGTSFELLAPDVSISVDGANAFAAPGGATYYDKATATIAQRVSGATAYYSFDGITFMQGDTVELAGESATFKVWAKSVLGGRESAVAVSDPVALDTEGPVLDPQVDNAWVAAPAVIKTGAIDAGAGVAMVAISPDEGTAISSAGRVAAVPANGTYELTARDNLGNESTASIEVATIDEAAPPPPAIYSAGEPVALTEYSLADGSTCYYGALTKSGSISFAPEPAHAVQSAEGYAVSYPYWNPSLSPTVRETDRQTWAEGARVNVGYSRFNPATIMPDTNTMPVPLDGADEITGRNVYVYCQDEAHPDNRAWYVFDTSEVAAGTNVYVAPYATDEAGGLSGSYDGGWTSRPVAFVLEPEIVEENGDAASADVRIDAIEYSTDGGSAWHSVTGSGAWKPADTTTLARGGTFTVSGDQQQEYLFRARASSNAYPARASASYPVKIDEGEPTVSVALADANGELSSEPEGFTRGPVTVTLTVGSDVESGASFEMRTVDERGEGDWMPVEGAASEPSTEVSLELSAEGHLRYEARAVSGAGVVGDAVAFATKIDGTPPRVTDIDYGQDGVTFTVSDASPDRDVEVSGAARLEYVFASEDGTESDPQSVSVQEGKATVSVPPDVRGIIRYSAVDAAGNESGKADAAAHGVSVGAITTDPATSADNWTKNAQVAVNVGFIFASSGADVQEVQCSDDPALLEAGSGTALALAADGTSASGRVSVSKKTTLHVCAWDADGVRSAMRAVDVYCDTDEPHLSVSPLINDGDPVDAPRREVKFSYEAYDVESGLRDVTRTVGDEVTVDDTFTANVFTAEKEGSYDVVVEAADKAGNAARRTFAVNIDRTAPSVKGVVYRPTATGTGTSMVVSTDDPESNGYRSGTDRIEYRLVASDGTEGEARTAVVADERATIAIDPGFDGTVRVRAADKAGNAGEAVDYPAQAIAIGSVATDPATSADAWTNRDGIEVSLGLTDNGGAGIARVFWSTEPGRPDGEPFVVSGAGTKATAVVHPERATTYYLNAYDANGAYGIEKSVTVYADRIAPELSVEPRERGTDSVWFPSITFDCTASDADSGLAGVTYTEAGETKHLEGGVFTVEAEGSYPVTVTAIDNAGNATSKTYPVHVVEADVAEVVNAVALLPDPSDPQAVIAAHRDDIMRTVQAFMALGRVQKAKVPEESLKRLEDLYGRIVPLVIDRTDDSSGIALLGLAFALDLPELDIPGAIVELRVQTRPIAEGGIGEEDLASIARRQGYELLALWDVVVEKRVIVGDRVDVELIGGERWLDGAAVLARFPLPDDALDAQGLCLVNLKAEGVEEIQARFSERAVTAWLDHLSYYGIARYHEPPLPAPALPGDAQAASDSLAPTGDPLGAAAAAFMALAAAAVLLLSARRRRPGALR